MRLQPALSAVEGAGRRGARRRSNGQLRLALEAEYIEARPVCGHVGSGISDRLVEQGLCLPSGSALAPEEQDRVIEVVRRMHETKVGVM